MVINDNRRKFIFIHIPKCGGISIESTIHRELGGDNKITKAKLIRIPPREDVKSCKGLHLHSTLTDYRKYYGKEKINDFYIFSFVRNPWRRIVSHYEYLIKDQYNIKIHDKDKLNFPLFVQVYRSNILPFSFNSYDHFLKDKYVNNINFIGKLENINEDMEKVGLDIKLELNNIYHMNQTDPKLKEHKNWKDYYNPGLKDRVYNMFKDDIERYNYDFDE